MKYQKVRLNKFDLLSLSECELNIGLWDLQIIAFCFHSHLAQRPILFGSFFFFVLQSFVPASQLSLQQNALEMLATSPPHYEFTENNHFLR